MTAVDIMHLVGIGFGALLVVVGAVLYAVEVRSPQGGSCLSVVIMLAGVFVALSSLP